MLGIKLRLPGISSKAKSYVESLYAVADPIGPHLSGGNRRLVLLSPQLVSGMNPKSTLNETDRATLVVDLEALVNKNVGSESQKRPIVMSLAVYRKISAKLLKIRPKFDVAADSLSTNDALLCGIRVAIMARSRIRMVYSETDKVIPAAARGANPSQTKLCEIQVGEVYIPAWKLGTTLSTPNGAARFPITGNGSGAIEMVDDLNDGLFVECVQAFAPLNPKTYWSDLETALVQGSYCNDIATADDRLMACMKSLRETYLDIFAPYDLTAEMSQSELHSYTQELSGSTCKIVPHQAQLSRYHVPVWDTYAVSGCDVARYGKTVLPIWMYSWPRSDLMNTPHATKKAAEFVDCCLTATLQVYHLDDIKSQKELQSVLRKYLSGKKEKITASDKALLVCICEMISHLLTLPAFLGKYRSDYRPGKLNGSVRPTESCDCNRISGQACSDDCEGSEACTREMFLLLTNPDVANAGSDQPELLKLLSTFVSTYYDYLSVSGSTTSAFPGCDIHSAASELAYPFDEKAYETIRKMRYGSREDSSAECGFHQYALLMPLPLLVKMYKTNAFFDNNPVRKESAAFLRMHSNYYKERISQIEAAYGGSIDTSDLDVLLPPPIVLESTYPVSMQLFGPSVFMYPEKEQPLNVSELGQMGTKIAAADTAAASAAKALKRVADGNSDVDLRAKDLHTLRYVIGRFELSKSDANGGQQQQQKLSRKDMESPRYASLFYRHACHAINVSYINHHCQKAEKPQCINTVGAGSFYTFINGSSNCFGVPLEDFLRNCLPKGHPYGYPQQDMHYLAHPFTHSNPSTLKALSSVMDQLRIMAYLPPVNFGTTHSNAETDLKLSCQDIGLDIEKMDPTGTWPARSRAAFNEQSSAERVLNTRVLSLEGEGVSEERLRDIVKQMVTALGGPQNVTIPKLQKIKLFTLFGDTQYMITACRIGK